MKVTKIEMDKKYPVCNDLLRHGYYSDALFDKCFIKVSIDVGNNFEAIIFRKLWEDVYIKLAKSITKFNPTTNELVVGITLSEAIGFIYKATPPRFQSSITESHKSVGDIISSMRTFLMGDNSYIAFSDMFFEYAHLKKFDTKWQNFNKIRTGADYISTNISEDKYYGFYVYASTHSVGELSEGKDNAQMGSSTTMICTKLDITNSEAMKHFCENIILNDLNDASFQVKVDNIHLEGKDIYVGWMMVVDTTEGAGVWTYVPRPYSDIIKYSYENIN